MVLTLEMLVMAEKTSMTFCIALRKQLTIGLTIGLLDVCHQLCYLHIFGPLWTRVLHLGQLIKQRLCHTTGIPCPIHVASPAVYSKFDPASYSYLAELLQNAIKDNFSCDVMSRLCGIAGDGSYQASGFREKILARMGIGNGPQNQLDLPVSWDAAHLINLGVLDVKDSKTKSGKHFQTFVKRCNIFNTVLANGKGFAFLQRVDTTARRPVSFATQRFTSSAYDQWLKIEKSYESCWKTFDMLYPNREEEEEYQYMIARSDFVYDFLAFLDTMKPVVELVLQVQSLDKPIWKLKCW